MLIIAIIIYNWNNTGTLFKYCKSLCTNIWVLKFLLTGQQFLPLMKPLFCQYQVSEVNGVIRRQSATQGL